MASSAILIPARWGSTRFPGKPLAALDGIPMVRRVYERCRKAAKEIDADVYVLTDHEDVCLRFEPHEVWVDDKDYANGTERCAGFISTKEGKKYSRVINVQGDMPDITPQIIEKTSQLLNEYEVSTVCTLMPEEEQNNPNTVKLIRGGGKCLWFGRGITGYGDWHLGVYGYRRETLKSYTNLIHYREEEIEQLEQLRWLKNGVQIGVIAVEWNGVEINTPEDVEKWNESR